MVSLGPICVNLKGDKLETTHRPRFLSRWRHTNCLMWRNNAGAYLREYCKVQLNPTKIQLSYQRRVSHLVPKIEEDRRSQRTDRSEQMWRNLFCWCPKGGGVVVAAAPSISGSIESTYPLNYYFPGTVLPSLGGECSVKQSFFVRCSQ